MDPQDDDDAEVGRGAFENGHWVWDEINNELIFISDALETPDIPLTTAILGAVDFKEDVDLNEQQRFRKRMQRKIRIGEEDVITVQVKKHDSHTIGSTDIKDVVLFTAPLKIVKPVMIHLLHQRATERFLRALILFCQYFLQISDLLAVRKLEQNTKVRTALSDNTEMEFRDNLEDLRLLVAKEYSNIILGSGEFAKYHHMGRQKKSRSLAKKDSLLFETFLRITIQIIWVALGRKSFNEIEIEVNRIFKSPLFNLAEHKLIRDSKITLNKISNTERSVLLGHCMVKKRHKVNMLSPLMSELLCNYKVIDHRMYGLGFIKYPELNKRLKYMEYALSLPEHLLERNGISIGILGLPRSRFDILLREIKFTTITSVSNVGLPKPPSRAGSSRLKRKSAVTGPLYPDVVLPPKEPQQVLADEFPTEVVRHRKVDLVQKQKWLQRIERLAAKRKSKSVVDIPEENLKLLKFIN